jgi:hypothetical protein
MTDMAMKMRLEALRQLVLGAALALSSAAGFAQSPAPSGVSYGPPAAEPSDQVEAPPVRVRQVRGELRPYLEVAQVVSTELDGGETLTYTNLAAGIDGRINTRRVRAAASYRYDRRIEWGSGNLGDRDSHSGVAVLNADVVPGAVSFDAGALATRTGGEGRALGVTDREGAVEVYSVYAGPTVSTHAGPVAINGSYRLGYVKVDDDSLVGSAARDFDDSTAHSLTASVGMAPGHGAPVGWTVGAGYARTDGGGSFEHEFEGAYVRGDVVVPVSPTLAVTAGVGYEDMEASQNDIARDSTGLPVIGPDGRPVADPNRPRLLTYDLEGIIYDAGIIWRPTPRTELQARAGHRYGGTTVVGSLRHRFSPHSGLTASVYDSVQTFGGSLISDISNLPTDFEIDRNPLTGGIGAGGCVFGADPGSGLCIDRSLQSIRGNSFRMRGGNVLFSTTRGLWSLGVGAGYNNRRYFRPQASGFDLLGGGEDENVSVYASAGRRLSRTSELDLEAFASWFDSDLAGSEGLFSTGATVSYRRSFLLDRLQLLSAFGLYHSDGGVADSSVASGLLGLRYGF